MIKMTIKEFSDYATGYNIEYIELGDDTNKTITRIDKSIYITEWLDGFVIMEPIK